MLLGYFGKLTRALPITPRTGRGEGVAAGEALVTRLQAELAASGAGVDVKSAALSQQLVVAQAALAAAEAKKSASSASAGASPRALPRRPRAASLKRAGGWCSTVIAWN